MPQERKNGRAQGPAPTASASRVGTGACPYRASILGGLLSARHMKRRTWAHAGWSARR